LIANNGNAQTLFTTSPDPETSGGLILKGILNKEVLQKEQSFKWFTNNQSSYNPDSSLINSFKKSKDSVSFILFGGTWCDDTQYILPRFFKLLELANIPDSAVTFFGVDRKKNTLDNISTIFNINHVPTIIVFKQGKEIGRVVEYGTTGKWDVELGELVD
jgi:thiol-disulfide isomerase/thioredoxin